MQCPSNLPGPTIPPPTSPDPSVLAKLVLIAAVRRPFEAASMLEEAAMRIESGTVDAEPRWRIGLAALLTETVGRAAL